MREVISIHIGQAGVQTGALCFLVLVFLACGRMCEDSLILSLCRWLFFFFFFLGRWWRRRRRQNWPLSTFSVDALFSNDEQQV